MTNLGLYTFNLSVRERLLLGKTVFQWVTELSTALYALTYWGFNLALVGVTIEKGPRGVA